MPIDEVRAIANRYRARVAANLGFDPSAYDGPYRAPFETRPVILWVEPSRVPGLLAYKPNGAVVVDPEDCAAMAAAWPPLPAGLPAIAREQMAETWGPSATRTVAVAVEAQ